MNNHKMLLASGFFFQILLQIVIPVLLIIFGMVMNVGVIVVFMRKRLKNSLSRNFFCLLSLNQILSLPTVFPFSINGYGIRILMLMNEYVCKSLTFLSFFFCAMCSWLLVLISLERLIFVNYKQIKVFKQTWFQWSIFGVIFAWNLIIYSFYSTFIDIGFQNESANSSNTHDNLYCNIIDPEAQFIWSTIDLLNSLLVPFILMIICSIGISISIYRTKNSLLGNSDTKEMKNLKMNMRFSVIIVSIDLAFLLFNLPYCIYGFCPLKNYNNIGYDLVAIFFSLQYLFNGFIFFFINIRFKKEIYVILKIKNKQKKKHLKNIKI